MRSRTDATADQQTSLALAGVETLQLWQAGRGDVPASKAKAKENTPETVLTFDHDAGRGTDPTDTIALRDGDPDPVAPNKTLGLAIEPPVINPAVTIDGTDGDDIIVGNAQSEYIDGKDGMDLIHGGMGNDTIFTQDGADSLYGDQGDDRVEAWNNDDNFVFGGVGNDHLITMNGHDEMRGEDGNDFVFSSGGNDVLYGGDGNDELMSGMGDDTIFGGDGSDYMFGTIGQDTMTGGADADLFAFSVTHMNDKDTITDFVIGEDLIYFADLWLFWLEPDQTLADVMVALEVDGGADLMALSPEHGWEVFAHFEGLDAADLQAVVDDESVFYLDHYAYNDGDPGAAQFW